MPSSYLTMNIIDDKQATGICDGELWDRISPDGCTKENSELPPEWHYLAFNNGVRDVGFWAYHYVDDKTLGIHINILNEFRNDYGLQAGGKLISHIKDKMGWINSVIAEIPECYPDVIKFAKKFGFNQVGTNKESIVKNGVNSDQVILILEIEGK